MKLRRLEIEREIWGERKDKYTAKIKIDDEKCDVSLELDEHVANQLLAICAEALDNAVCVGARDFRKRLAEAMSAPLLESQ